MSNAIFPTLPGLMWSVLKRPQFNTSIQKSIAGKETRYAYRATPIWKWTLTYELLRASAVAELQALAGFFTARQGAFDSFLFSDPSDNIVTLHGFGAGDGATTTFQLQRSSAGPRDVDPISGTTPVPLSPRTNLLIGSSNFANGAWTRPGSPGLGITSGSIAAPDNTLTGYLITQSAANEFHYMYQVVSRPVGSSPTFTGSGYFRAREYTSIVLEVTNGGTSAYGQAVFNLVAGTVSGIVSLGGNSNTTAAIDPIGNGWFRCSVTTTFSPADGQGSAVTWQCWPGTTAGGALPGDGRTSFYLWGAQLEEGVLSPYLPTVGAAVTVNPAYYPQGVDGFEAVPDLAFMPIVYVKDWQGTTQLATTARTNLIPGALTVGGTNWAAAALGTGSAPVVTAGFAVGPNGVAGAANRLQYSQGAGTTSGDQSFSQSTSPTASFVGCTYLASVWLKSNTTVNQTVMLTLTSTAAAAVTVTPFWQRFTVVFTNWPSTAAPALQLGARGTFTPGSTSLDILAYGAQVEIVAPGVTAPSRLITTTTVPVSVGADYTVSALGVVTFAVAPLAGAALLWTGGYYWRVRFDQDAQDFNNFLYQLWEAKSVAFVSAL